MVLEGWGREREDEGHTQAWSPARSAPSLPDTWTPFPQWSQQPRSPGVHLEPRLIPPQPDSRGAGGEHEGSGPRLLQRGGKVRGRGRISSRSPTERGARHEARSLDTGLMT
uniref:Uncharacterized protein n=1 Tax=Mustela putorius furo TaxID=9669 RepID=M3YAM8_MUSPF